MTKAVDAVKSVFDSSGGARTQAEMAKQDAALRRRERAVARTAEGQRRAHTSNRGLLAYVDDFLAQTFGGG